MKNFILKSIILIVLLCCSVDIAAFFKVDGITYDIVSDTDLTVSVTYDQNSYYSGDIVIPESVQYEGKTYRVVAIGYLAFESCWGLRSLSLPEGMLKIGNNAFSGCTSLESLVLPRTVEEIGEYAFQGCNELISFTFSESLKYVGQNAFEGCVKLEEVNVQDVNTLLNIEYVNEKSNPLYFAHNLKSEDILVTSFVMTDSVNVIKPYAFCGCTSLQNIDFGKKIKTIGKYAFDGCNGLKKITVPDNVEVIQDWAFHDCKSLESVSIGNKVDSIYDYVFSGCDALETVVIPDNVTYIGESVLSRCAKLKTVTIGNGITDILPYAFQECKELFAVSLGEKINSIGYWAFNGCSKLAEINFPTSVRKIDASAFDGTVWLESQPEGIVYAGPVAFKYKGLMSQETDVVIKEGTKSIANDLFYYNGSNIANVKFPSTLELIGAWSFYKATNLKSIEIPDSVEVVGEGAFSNCMNLEAVVLGENLRELGNGVFAENGKIETIIVKSIDVPDYNLSIWDPIDPFMENVYSDAVLTVPAESIDAYKSSKYWGKFHNIIADCSHIEDFGYDKISIKVIKGNIVIEGSDDMIKTVYNADGQIVYKGIDQTIEVGSSGIYIIRIEGCARKVIL